MFFLQIIKSYSAKKTNKPEKMKTRLEKIMGIRREKHFIRNGAMLLEKEVSLFRGKDLGCEPCKVFSANDIKRATGNYDLRLIIGRKIATVFKGDVDGRTVAIKTFVGDPVTYYPVGLLGVSWLVDFFLNQVAIKQVINHKHIVALHGCCLETQVPILVFEFLPNGTLHDHLHLHRNPSTISWPDRVRIAAEVSLALAYMHLGTWKPIVHLDVKSSNIFLDENFTAKLSNFGFSVPISPGDEYSQGRSLLGTPGYTDPEYQETLKVNEKCDVYSFGVLLVELLTGYDPFELMVIGSVGLGDRFLLAMTENKVVEIVDGKVLGEGKAEEIEQFCKIAFKCLGKGVDRPTMPEVAGELRQMYHHIIIS